VLSLQGSDRTHNDGGDSNNNFNLVRTAVPSVVGGVLLFVVLWWVCMVRVRGERKRKGEKKGKGREVEMEAEVKAETGMVAANTAIKEMEAVGDGGGSLRYGGGYHDAGDGSGGFGFGEGSRAVGYAGDDQGYGQDRRRWGTEEREVIPIVMVRNGSRSDGTQHGGHVAGAGPEGGYWGDRHWQWPGGYV
jgi:hypothetical protein